MNSQRFSIGLIVVLLVLGILINVWQGGSATTLTYVGYAPLALYLLYIGVRLIFTR